MHYTTKATLQFSHFSFKSIASVTVICGSPKTCAPEQISLVLSVPPNRCHFQIPDVNKIERPLLVKIRVVGLPPM